MEATAQEDFLFTELNNSSPNKVSPLWPVNTSCASSSSSSSSPPLFQCHITRCAFYINSVLIFFQFVPANTFFESRKLNGCCSLASFPLSEESGGLFTDVHL